MANLCLCSLKTGRFVTYLCDLVMALFVTILTGLLVQSGKNGGEARSLACSIILLIDIFSVLHLGSVWRSVWTGIELVEIPKLRLWFVSTGFIFLYFQYEEPLRCAFLTILAIYYFVSLFLTYTLANAAVIAANNPNRVNEDGSAANANSNHELKEIKVEPAGPAAPNPAAAPLVEVALNEGHAAPQ